MQFAKLRSCRKVQYHAVKSLLGQKNAGLNLECYSIYFVPSGPFFCGHSYFFSKGISCHHHHIVTVTMRSLDCCCRGLESYSSDFGCICNMGNARNNRAENDRCNNHLPEGGATSRAYGSSYKWGYNL